MPFFLKKSGLEGVSKFFAFFVATAPVVEPAPAEAPDPVVVAAKTMPEDMQETPKETAEQPQQVKFFVMFSKL